MKKIYILTAFIVCCFISTTLYAQDYRPGYIVKNNNDSISGYVAYQSLGKSASQCLFKTKRGIKPTKYGPNDLQHYGITGDREYASLTLPGSADGKVFCNVLVKSTLSLYRYGKAFVIEYDSVILLPTPEDKQIETWKGVMTGKDNRYVGILNYIISDCQLDANATAYTETDLTNLVNNYNRCKGQAPTYKKRRPAVKMNYSVFASYVLSDMNMYVQDPINFESSKTVAGGIGADLSAPRIFDRLFITFEAWYIKSLYQAYKEDHFNGDERHRDIYMDFSYFKAPIGIRYNFFGGTNTPYVKAGFTSFFLHKSSVKTIVEKETSDGTVLTTEIDGGYDLKNPRGIWFSVGYDRDIFRGIRVFTEFRYERADGFVGTAIQSFSKVQNYNFLFGVRF